MFCLLLWKFILGAREKQTPLSLWRGAARLAEPGRDSYGLTDKQMFATCAMIPYEAVFVY